MPRRKNPVLRPGEEPREQDRMGYREDPVEREERMRGERAAGLAKAMRTLFGADRKKKKRSDEE